VSIAIAVCCRIARCGNLHAFVTKRGRRRARKGKRGWMEACGSGSVGVQAGGGGTSALDEAHPGLRFKPADCGPQHGPASPSRYAAYPVRGLYVVPERHRRRPNTTWCGQPLIWVRWCGLTPRGPTARPSWALAHWEGIVA
jgi:hypothetical protein